MGRGRVQLKRIENKITRQITFSKRRQGLLKKAHEISVLCDADVALILFSAKGKLFEYSTDSCMERILERYDRYSKADKLPVQTDLNYLRNNWPLECSKLKARIEVLQKNERNIMGEELDALSLKQLQSFEQQIDTALRRIRTRRNQLMNESISELQKKEKAMQNQNNILVKQIKENEKAIAEQVQQHQCHIASTFMLGPPLPLPSLTIGRSSGSGTISEEKNGAQARPKSNALMPPWMLSHLNQ